MSRFSEAYGGKKKTMKGLAGLGDLIATAESPLSRNHKAGEMLGKGYRLNEVIKRLSQTAEGLSSIAPVLALAEAKGIKMPIVEQVHAVMQGKMHPREIAPHLTHGSDEPQGE
jgi:glycerol-3-phosphate dehydrogenase (NAD(P)+)